MYRELTQLSMRQMMRVNRRQMLATSLAGSAAAVLPAAVFGQPEVVDSNYSKLDAVLQQPVFKKELFEQPVVIDSVELLHYKRSFLCRVRSKDGAEGVSVAHDTMSLLYPIFVKNLQPFFLHQDVRRLDELVEKALDICL